MPRIIGDRIILREYRQEDLPSIRAWVNNSAIVDNLSDIFLFPHSLNETQSFLNNILENKNSQQQNFIIADKTTEKYIGQIDLIHIDWKNRVAEMGIVIGNEDLLGKGFGTEAIKLLQTFVFERMNMNRLQLTLHDYNQRAYHCYLKCGFSEEGRLRQKYFINGKYTDVILMGILHSEYLTS